MHGDLADITGLIGQYAHGNEPSHHIAYLYDYVGQPWKTQEMTHATYLMRCTNLLREVSAAMKIVDRCPHGIILSGLGIYSVCPGSNEFALTTPLFEKAVLKLANGKRLTLLANDPKKNIYIHKVELNGKQIDTNFITYAQLMEGGELRFTLSDKPDKSRGISEEASPYSYTKEKVVSIPYVDRDLNLFMDKVTVALATTTEGAELETLWMGPNLQKSLCSTINHLK